MDIDVLMLAQAHLSFVQILSNQWMKGGLNARCDLMRINGRDVN
jgi:hypothetical protein